MAYHQNNLRRRRRWISLLFLLIFLLIFVFTRSLVGLFASLAIIVLLWVLIAVASPRRRTWNTPMPQPPFQQPTGPIYTPEMPYEQGYLGAGNTAQPAVPPQVTAAPLSQPYSYPPQGPGVGEEDDRLAQFKLLGDLYHAGILTSDEFERQKQRILQADATKEASEPEAVPTVVAETQYEEQPQVPYPQA
jgi:hypothetical protein